VIQLLSHPCLYINIFYLHTVDRAAPTSRRPLTGLARVDQYVQQVHRAAPVGTLVLVVTQGSMRAMKQLASRKLRCVKGSDLICGVDWLFSQVGCLYYALFLQLMIFVVLFHPEIGGSRRR